MLTLLAFTALSAVQSSTQTRIHSANNASYNQVHWLVGTPYLAVKASSGFAFRTSGIPSPMDENIPR